MLEISIPMKNQQIPESWCIICVKQGMFLVHVMCWVLELYHEPELGRVLLTLRMGRRGRKWPIPMVRKYQGIFLCLTTKNPVCKLGRWHSVK